MPASYATHRQQLELILRAWGMPEAAAASTAEIMRWADLHGIDTHAISMVPPYDERRPAGKIDIATTTVAAGKIRNKANENLPTPPGWLVTADGKPSTDPREVSKGGFMTPLGGTPEGSSHKGYGLSAMVNILSSALSGATMVTDPMHTKKPGTMNIGHFLLALDPGLFRDASDFRADVAAFCDALRATKPAEPDRPVLVAGEPERRTAAQRRPTG